MKETRRLKTLQKNTCRAINFEQLWLSKESSFAKIRKYDSEKISKLLLLIEAQNMVKLINADMQEVQIDYLVNYILKDFYYFTISDLTIITNRLVTLKPYGRPVVANLINEINQYDIERSDYAETKRIEEKESHKGFEKVGEYIVKAYHNMKKEAKKPKLSQKEKDKINFEENEKKIAELKLLYPEDNNL